jgi:hypothetical protein
VGRWSPNWVHSARRPFILGLLYLPRVIVRMENLVELIGRGNRSTRRKPAPAPLCTPQIPLDQTRARTRADAVGSQRLTAWAMARPYGHDTGNALLFHFLSYLNHITGCVLAHFVMWWRSCLRCFLMASISLSVRTDIIKEISQARTYNKALEHSNYISTIITPYLLPHGEQREDLGLQRPRENSGVILGQCATYGRHGSHVVQVSPARASSVHENEISDLQGGDNSGLCSC